MGVGGSVLGSSDTVGDADVGVGGLDTGVDEGRGGAGLVYR